MESNSHHNYQHQQHENHQTNSGLLRFRSAPSSLLSNFTEECVGSGANKGNFTEGSESERLTSRFLNFGGSADSTSPSFQDFEGKPPVLEATEAAANRVSSRQGYSGGLPPHYPKYSTTATTSSAMEGPYGLVGSTAMDRHVQTKVNSNIVRQSSSPAGLFSQISIPNGYASMNGVGNYGGVNGTSGDVSPSTNRLKSQISFSSRLPSSLGMLSQISELGTETVGPNSPRDGKLVNGNDDARFYGLGFPYSSWNEPSHLAENFAAMKREQNDDEGKLFYGTQDGGLGTRVHVLSHHLSLPKTSSEIVAMEKFLQFQDSIPCKIRAKRGCATHPRSIAERVRRTRISERMRKLQELVPNMDKQTNTADMLDLAVDYIKDLQEQFKTLSENQANCKCLSMQNPVSNQIA